MAITHVWSREGMTFHYQGDPEPGIWIEQSGGRYYLKTISSNDMSEAPNMGGEAVCVDIVGDAPGSWTDAVASNLRVCNGSVTRGWFSGIFGDFNGSTSTGISLQNDLSGGAELNSTGGKSVFFDCVW